MSQTTSSSRRAPHERAQVAAFGREETGVQTAVGGEARTGAVGAERLGDRGDDADLPRAVAVAPPLGDLARVLRLHRLDRHLGVDAPHDLARRDDVVEAPAVRVADVHVLDEPQDVPGAAEVPSHRQDALFVESATDDHVDLHRPQPRRGRRVDAREDPLDGEVDVVHAAEDLVVERVEAHGHALQAGGGERLRLTGEKRAVRGEGEVDSRELRELGDEHVEAASHERFATGEAHLLDAEPGEDPRQPRELLERQQLVLRHELIAAAEDLLRHAVDAAEVATIGDRDPQIPERPAERVVQGHLKSMRPAMAPSGLLGRSGPMAAPR